MNIYKYINYIYKDTHLPHLALPEHPVRGMGGAVAPSAGAVPPLQLEALATGGGEGGEEGGVKGRCTETHFRK